MFQANVFFYLIGLFLFFIFCNQKNFLNIPAEARFDSKKEIYFYKDKKGNETAYYTSGKMYYECKIELKNTKFCKYYTKQGQTIGFGQIKNGNRNGIWIWKFPNGNLYLKQSYDYRKKRDFWISTSLVGNENGKFERFYISGRKDLIGFYKAGYKEGVWQKFFPTGQLEFIGEYKKDKKIKKWFYYYSNGDIEAEEFFTKDGDFIERKTYTLGNHLLCKIESERFSCNQKSF